MSHTILVTHNIIIINNNIIITTWNIFSTTLKHFRFSEFDLLNKTKGCIPDSWDGAGGQTDRRPDATFSLCSSEGKTSSKDDAL